MSEYQYYEFLALDRPLSSDDLAYVRTLSRRVEPTSTNAVFTYSYGNFPGDPLALLAKHYDAMLYLANWGTKQLAFRFPKGAIDEAALQPYVFGADQITLTTVGKYVILDLSLNEEEGLGWIEGEGLLGPLVPLRDDIMRGDLRALYLTWLAVAERGFLESEWQEDEDEADAGGDDEDEDEADADGGDDSVIEPPLPPGLKQLSAPLRALIDFFAIDQDFVQAAAAASPPLKATDEPIERWVALLPENERTTFLVEAARGTPIGATLLRRLRQVGGAERPAPVGEGRRSLATIRAEVEKVRRERQERERQEAERARLAKLDALARREEQIWAEIPQLFARRNASGYDEGVGRLVELRELAVHRSQLDRFNERVQTVVEPYAASVALKRRLQERKIV